MVRPVAYAALGSPRDSGDQAQFVRLLTESEAANFLRVSESWLAKARMRGDGPPYVKIGRLIRYGESTLVSFPKIISERIGDVIHPGLA